MPHESSPKNIHRRVGVGMFAFAAACLIAFLTPCADASGALSLGTVTEKQTPLTCPGGQWVPGMTCISATISNCADVDDITLTYGKLIPSSGKINGLIVYLDGGNGTDAANETPERQMMYDYYNTDNYAVVEIQWSTAWEQTTSPNIQNAACRPATFLNHIYTNIYKGIATGTNGNPAAGMCAQGFSFGSAAIVYSLAYYGAGDYLDNVELISGPPASDIEQGCEVPNASPVTVCPNNQYGCKLGSDSPWTLGITYVAADANYLTAWTGSNSGQQNQTSCAGSTSTPTSWDTTWLAESIVDQPTVSGGPTPTFSYPKTSMSGYLCRTVQNPNNVNCSTNYRYDYCPNNTSVEGQLFYSQITSSNSPPSFSVYSVDGCNGPEGVPLGTVSYDGGESAQSVIESDMISACSHSQ